ncbi:MAG: DUF4202 domain-containing protein [Planctomycetota bacterium]|jgi:hypothetical protein
MSRPGMLDEAIRQMDALNQEDPRKDLVDGEKIARELRFSRLVSDWVRRLRNEPSEALQLAARGHTLCRWKVRRSDYGKTTADYHQWRTACATKHAEEADQVLETIGYDEATRNAVRAFILKSDWPGDEEACALEDADCLAFLEMKLADYLDEWDDEKMIRILARTMKKMTATARQHALNLPLSAEEKALLNRAREVIG